MIKGGDEWKREAERGQTKLKKRERDRLTKVRTNSRTCSTEEGKNMETMS